MSQKQKLNVGLVMPIAATDGLDQGHWLDVKKIICDALNEDGAYDFDTKIVSESDSVGLIHKRIVQGLYKSDIVVCDVSCRNPNVMFELGMRLAFDKPTVIIKDDKTNFTFDAGVIEHLEYPRDLRFNKILDFKSLLAGKVIATYRDSQADPNHSPFLKSYGEFQAVKIDETEISASEMMINMLAEMQNDIATLKTKSQPKNKEYSQNVSNNLEKLMYAALLEYVLEHNISKEDFYDIKHVMQYLDHKHHHFFGVYDAIDIERAAKKAYVRWSASA